MCKECGVAYIISLKRREYPKERACHKIYYLGISGRGGVGKILGISNRNVYIGIEKTEKIMDSTPPLSAYYTDGYLRYVDVVYSSSHIRNM